MITTKDRRNPGKTILTREAIGCVAGAAAVVAGAPVIVPSRVLGTELPSKRITIGCIGVGNEGFGHNTKTFLVEPDARIVAVCDVLAQHRTRAKEAVDARYSNKDCREYADFREVLARKDIDAVMIGTPDHWHVPLSLMALEAGKDVFCEKPTLTIAEGRALAEGEGERPKNSMSTTFVAFKVHYRYAGGVELFVESGGTALRIEGSDGWVGNNRWRGPLEASSQDLLRQKFPAETNKIWPLPPYEHRNFLDCVKSRKPTTYTAEAGHRLSTVMHIGNIAMTLGRKLKWDPQSESFPGDEAANNLRSRPLRDDWKK